MCAHLPFKRLPTQKNKIETKYKNCIVWMIRLKKSHVGQMNNESNRTHQHLEQSKIKILKQERTTGIEK